MPQAAGAGHPSQTDLAPIGAFIYQPEASCTRSGMSLIGRAAHLGLLLGLGWSTACGDPGYDMRIVNATDATLTVYELGAYRTGDQGARLSPGDTKISTWFRPRDERDSQLATVKAVDGNGTVVFCRQYSYERARDNFLWTITVVRGVDECT